MTPAELREAAERLLDDSDKGYWVRATKHCKVADMEAIARHYLAEHPADDETPIDEAWLRSVGFVDGTGMFAGHLVLGDVQDCLAPFPLFYSLEYDCWEYGSTPLPHYTTRGQLRRLCDALGITLREATT